MTPTALVERLSAFPRVEFGHLNTPLEPMPRLGAELGVDLWVKRDDCTGVGLGGNKVRQLQWYLGKAQAERADAVLITGAVQSNFVRSTAAMAARLGLACHVQLEERVPDVSALHRSNGNVLLNRLFGAVLHSYPQGEDEAGADRALRALADDLTAQGGRPFVIPLSVDGSPIGALGYVDAAAELLAQISAMDVAPDAVVLASGSALTHAGLLLGLRLLGSPIIVHGVCVRRPANAQAARVALRIAQTAQLLGAPDPTNAEDIKVADVVLAPGYGRLNPATHRAIRRCAETEGILLDPVYTGKAMAGLTHLVDASHLRGKRVLFWHTGGQPAVFGYAEAFA